jgi:hypothetical protein
MRSELVGDAIFQRGRHPLSQRCVPSFQQLHWHVHIHLRSPGRLIDDLERCREDSDNFVGNVEDGPVKHKSHKLLGFPSLKVNST